MMLMTFLVLSSVKESMNSYDITYTTIQAYTIYLDREFVFIFVH
jgi:hypothetical protein